MAARPRQVDDLDFVLHEAVREAPSVKLDTAHLGVCGWSEDSRRVPLSRSCAASPLSVAPIGSGGNMPAPLRYPILLVRFMQRESSQASIFMR
jgi:hypothetical protein